jgi:N-acetylmuramic acid 6-phosphate etherase
MQLSNDKLIDRGVKMIVMETGVDRVAAATLLNTHGSVRKAIDAYNKS